MAPRLGRSRGLSVNIMWSNELRRSPARIAAPASREQSVPWVDQVDPQGMRPQPERKGSRHEDQRHFRPPPRPLPGLRAARTRPADARISSGATADRPPENRDPLPKEIEIYGPFLDQQIEIIEPQVITTLGRYSMQYIMQKFGLSDVLRPISQMHGCLFEARASYGLIKILPLYHPAATIYNRALIDDLKTDFKKLKANS